MNARLRAAITILFVLAFFVTAPVILMLTSGYRYNWKRQRVQKTGIIQVETTPPGAHVFLDGTRQRRVTPSAFPRLLPEDYHVRIEKKEYLPWEKTLEVRSGETTFATGVVLYKDALPRLVVDRDVVAASWSPDGTDAVFLADDGGWKELVALTDGGEPVLLARFTRDAYADPAISWSPDGEMVLFSAIATDGGTHALRFRPDAPTATLVLHENFPKGSLVARWSSDGSRIAIVSADGVFAADADTGAVSPLLLVTGVKDADMRGRSTYALRTIRGDDGQDATALERLNGSDAVRVLLLPAGDYSFLEGDERHLLISDGKKRRITLVDPVNAATQTYEAIGAAWETEGRRLLLWNDFEIFTVNVSEGSRDLITRIGAPIIGSAWSPSGEAVLFATSNGISVAELDGRDRRNVFDLVRFTNVGPFAVDPAANVLRFVGSVGNQRGIYEREL